MDSQNLHQNEASLAQMLSIRSHVVKRYKILGISMAVVCIFSIISGIVIVSSNSSSSASPIWSGVIVLIGAVSLISLGHTDPERKTESDKIKQINLVRVSYLFALMSLPLCGLNIAMSVRGADACRRENSETCGDNVQVEVAMNIIAVLTGVVLITCCVVEIVMLIHYAKAFNFNNNRGNRLVQLQMLILQQQQQLAAQNRDQPVQTTHPPTQTGYLNTQTNFGTNWSTLPPSYSEVVDSSTNY